MLHTPISDAHPVEPLITPSNGGNAMAELMTATKLQARNEWYWKHGNGARHAARLREIQDAWLKPFIERTVALLEKRGLLPKK